MKAPSDWQARCGIQKIVQTDAYGCGIACLAMVTDSTYERARERFNELGLGVRRSCRPAFSTSSREMFGVLARTGLMVDARRWKGWDSFHGLGVMKIRATWRGEKRWHWAVAFRHSKYGIAVFDPHEVAPSFEKIPEDVLCFDYRIHEPKGEWFQVEQCVRLERDCG